MQPEIRYFELRQSGERELSGTALRYGDIATLPWGQERIEAGAFAGSMGDVILNRQHDRSKPLARTGGGLVLNDTPEALTLRATLPKTTDADDTLALVEAGVLRGFSIEFHAKSERFEDELRIIERAVLIGVAAVDSGAYPQSLIQARQAALEELTRARPVRRVWL